MKAGKLTAFCFHVVENKRTLFGYQKKLKKNPFVYIPVSECEAWARELEQRSDRQSVENYTREDWDGDYVESDPKDKGDSSVEYVDQQVSAKEVAILLGVTVREVWEKAKSRILPPPEGDGRHARWQASDILRVRKKLKDKEQGDGE